LYRRGLPVHRDRLVHRLNRRAGRDAPPFPAQQHPATGSDAQPNAAGPAPTTCEGRRDILGLWAGDGGEGAKYWLHVLTELKNRGVADVLMAVCDGLAGLPEAITTVWPRTVTQTLHLLRNSFRYAGRQHWDAIAKALRRHRLISL
jgi:hypothetical protein